MSKININPIIFNGVCSVCMLIGAVMGKKFSK